MGAVTATLITDLKPNGGLKEVYVVVPATAAPGDTVAITLANYGISNLLAVEGLTHTTANSVVVDELITTSVTTGVLTITFPSGTGNTSKMRVVRLMGGN
jgi:hypothetical protein